MKRMAIAEEYLLKFKADTTALNQKLSQTSASVDRIERKVKTTNAQFAAMGKALIALGLVRVISGISSTIQRFEKLQASLITVTGSTEAAATAFEKIQEFAATTPFQLDEVVNSFIKLKSLGLDPSEDALRSYGNTASAMGKSLNQVIEAVADAATSEFERLKEFGIKAKQEGDRVTFLFQGVSTEVGNNASEITEFLQGIGDVQFAGAMERQADDLSVALSNLGDEIDKLIVDIGEGGLTGVLISAANTVKGLVQDIRDLGKNLSLISLSFTNTEIVQMAEDINGISVELQRYKDIQAGVIESGRVFLGIDSPDESRARAARKVIELEKEKLDLQNRYNAAVNEGVNLPEVVTNTVLTTEEREEQGAAQREAEAASQAELDRIKKEGEARAKLKDIAKEAAKARKQLESEVQSILDGTLTKEEVLAQQIEKVNKARLAGIIATDEEMQKAIDHLKSEADELGNALADSFDRAVDSMIDGSKSVADIVTDLFVDMSRDILRDALQPLKDGFRDAITGKGFGGGTNQSDGLLGGLGSFLGDSLGSIFSFDGGGDTPSGSRSGGVDGKGGFPAILHPDETVIDHTKGQSISSGGGSTFIQNNNNSFTSDMDIDRRIKAQQPVLAQQTADLVLAKLQSGGDFSRVVGNRL